MSDINVPNWVREAKSGDKIVCMYINDEARNKYNMEKGNIYTIESIIPGYDYGSRPTIGFSLVGINSGKYKGFIWYNFKPVEKNKFDISIFTNMLETKEVEIENV